MSDSLALLCSSFVENKEVLKSYFGREQTSVNPICAAFFTERQKQATEENLSLCRELLRSSESPSEFRGAAVVPVIAILAADENPAEKLQRAVSLFSALRHDFPGSPYLSLASLFVSDMADPTDYLVIADRAARNRDIIARKHLFQEGEDLSMPSALLAVSDLKRGIEPNRNEAAWDAEVVLTRMQEDFYTDDSLLAQSLVLGMTEGDAHKRAERNIAYYNSLEEKHVKLGDSYSYGIFAFLSMLPESFSAINEALFRADNFLANQKGYSGIFATSRSKRLLHAAYMTSIAGVFHNDQLWDAQQAAMCLAIAASASNL